MKLTPGLPGFTTSRIDSVTLEVGQSKTLNLTLDPGDIKQSVTVTDEAPLITTDRADRGTVVENQFVTSIPLLTRNPLLLVTMTAGAIGTATPGGGLVAGDNTVSENQTNYFRINGGPQPVQRNPDRRRRRYRHVQQSGGRDSPSGRRTGVQDQHESRTTRNWVTQAAASSATPSSPARTSSTATCTSSCRTQSSTRTGSMPIRQARQAPASEKPVRLRARRAAIHSQALQRQEPHLLLLRLRGASPAQFFLVHRHRADQTLRAQGDFSSTFDSNGALKLIYDPSTTRLDPTAPAGTTRYIRDVFPSNRIPASQINPIATNLLKYFPAPNQRGIGLSDTNNYFSPAPSTLDNNRIDARIDHKFSDKHSCSPAATTSPISTRRPMFITVRCRP